MLKLARWLKEVVLQTPEGQGRDDFNPEIGLLQLCISTAAQTKESEGVLVFKLELKGLLETPITVMTIPKAINIFATLRSGPYYNMLVLDEGSVASMQETVTLISCIALRGDPTDEVERDCVKFVIVGYTKQLPPFQHDAAVGNEALKLLGMEWLLKTFFLTMALNNLQNDIKTMKTYF